MKSPFSERLLRFVARFEDAVLAALLSAMIGLSALQIVLRNVFETGILWADPLVRILVLWVGLVGAMVATRLDNHITINVIARFLPPRGKHVARVLVDLFAALVTALLAVHGARFVGLEYESGGTAFAAVPVWACELIIPVAFAVMALRYVTLAAVHARALGSARS